MATVRMEGFQELERRLDPRRLMDRVADAMQETVDFAAEVQRDTIEHSGTQREWQGDWGSMPHGTPGRTASSPGRVASAEMRDAVRGEVTEASQTRVVGEVGWWDDAPYYTEFQENGFAHRLAQRDIEGMYSLREAAEQGADELLSQLDKIARDL